MKMLKTFQAEMNAVVLERRVRTVIMHNIPPFSDWGTKIELDIFIYSENRKGAGTFIVIHVDDKMVAIQAPVCLDRRSSMPSELSLFFGNVFLILVIKIISPSNHSDSIKSHYPRSCWFETARRNEYASLVDRKTR